MTRRPAVACAALALVAWLCSAAPAGADRETAEFLAKRGDKALKEKAFEGALEQYRHALSEDETYLPARLGAAESLAGAGRTQEAIEELRGLVAAAEAAKPLPPAWGDLLPRARKRLDDLDVAGAAVEQAVSRYVEDLVALAARWSKGEPAVAERALRRALDLRPGHERATKLLAALGADAGGRRVSLLAGNDAEGWLGVSAPHWACEKGVLVGELADGATEVNTIRLFEGDFDVLMEARIVATLGEKPMIGLAATVVGLDDQYKFGMLMGEQLLLDDERPATPTPRRAFAVLFRNLKKPPDPKGWNLFELRFRGDEVTALVNGQVVGKDRRPKERRSGGVGLIAQHVRAEFRRVEVLQR